MLKRYSECFESVRGVRMIDGIDISNHETAFWRSEYGQAYSTVELIQRKSLKWIFEHTVKELPYDLRQTDTNNIHGAAGPDWVLPHTLTDKQKAGHFWQH